MIIVIVVIIMMIIVIMMIIILIIIILIIIVYNKSSVCAPLRQPRAGATSRGANPCGGAGDVKTWLE